MFFINDRNSETCLNCRYYLPLNELTFLIYLNFGNWGIGIFSSQVKPGIGTEITKAVANQTIIVEFHGSCHVRTMTKNNICTGVNYAVCKLAYISAIVSKVYFIGARGVNGHRDFAIIEVGPPCP